MRIRWRAACRQHLTHDGDGDQRHQPVRRTAVAGVLDGD